MIIKIAIQATVYATLTFIIIYVLSKMTNNEILKKWMDEKFRTWWLIGLVFSVGLFFFAFSYWGNHGLGDSSRIPIGHEQAIHNGDGAWTYFYPKPDSSIQQFIGNYSIRNNRLCAEVENHKYLIFDLETSEIIEFENQQSYTDFANNNNLPEVSEFEEFMGHYQEYWNGWRFYMLP